MKNKIVDLNNHLFAQLERLSDESLSTEQIALECDRTEAIVAVSEQLLRSAAISVDVAKLTAAHGARVRENLPLLEAPKTVDAPPK